MRAGNLNFVALTLGFALVSPAAYPQLAPVTNTVGRATTALPSVPETHVQASDAVSARTTVRETGAVNSAQAKAQASDSPSAQASSSTSGTGSWWRESDRNGDGKLSATEASGNAGLSSRFSSIDSDKDGLVTSEEYRAFYAVHAEHAAHVRIEK